MGNIHPEWRGRMNGFCASLYSTSHSLCPSVLSLTLFPVLFTMFSFSPLDFTTCHSCQGVADAPVETDINMTHTNVNPTVYVTHVSFVFPSGQPSCCFAMQWEGMSRVYSSVTVSWLTNTSASRKPVEIWPYVSAASQINIHSVSHMCVYIYSQYLSSDLLIMAVRTCTYAKNSKV